MAKARKPIKRKRAAKKVRPVVIEGGPSSLFGFDFRKTSNINEPSKPSSPPYKKKKRLKAFRVAIGAKNQIQERLQRHKTTRKTLRKAYKESRKKQRVVEVYQGNGFTKKILRLRDKKENAKDIKKQAFSWIQRNGVQGRSKMWVQYSYDDKTWAGTRILSQKSAILTETAMIGDKGTHYVNRGGSELVLEGIKAHHKNLIIEVVIVTPNTPPPKKDRKNAKKASRTKRRPAKKAKKAVSTKPRKRRRL